MSDLGYKASRPSTGDTSMTTAREQGVGQFEEYEFISPSDKPALLALSSLETMANVQTICLELGYKVHVASNHEDFSKRFLAMNYQLVIVEELFAAEKVEDNIILARLQNMPMSQRRHATLILIGEHVHSMNAMEAFQQSVHAVVNKSDISSLGQIISKTTTDNDVFLHTYREVHEAGSRGELR